MAFYSEGKLVDSWLLSAATAAAPAKSKTSSLPNSRDISAEEATASEDPSEKGRGFQLLVQIGQTTDQQEINQAAQELDQLLRR